MNTATFPTYDTVDLFAGPGGWSVAAQRLGLREIGLEFDKAAHLTRRAAGFHTIRDDVRNWGPANFPNAHGLIASPPCQTFSAAGKGAGRRALDVVLEAVEMMGTAHTIDGRAWGEAVTWEDERTGLVLEPLRWALEAIRLDHPYEWLAFEQVPTVLPVWQAMAEVLRAEGYSVSVGNLQAEQYGVPQTRKRAVLMARLLRLDGTDLADQLVTLPPPTHSRYHTRDKTQLDPSVLPWVSMAQALGWGMTARPYPTIACSRSTGGPDMEKVGGSAGRLAIYTELAAGRWQLATGTRPKAALRTQDEPSPTLAFGHDAASYTWTPEGTTVLDVVAWKAANGGMRLGLEDAGVLQSFPVDFPWQGTNSKQYQQIGNAIPPLLAEAVLASALGRTLPGMTP